MLDDGSRFRIDDGILFLRVVQVGNALLDGALGRGLAGHQPDDGEAQQQKQKEDQPHQKHGWLLRFGRQPVPGPLCGKAVAASTAVAKIFIASYTSSEKSSRLVVSGMPAAASFSANLGTMPVA